MSHKFSYTLYEAMPKKNFPIASFNELQLAMTCQRLIEKSKMHKYPLFISMRNGRLKEVM
jgi:hypothetical protein